MLRGHPLVSQAIVVGDAPPAVGALVTLDPESVEAWLRDRQRPPTPVAELVEDPEVLADVQAAVDAANATVSAAEEIKRFRILPVDLTEASGHLTPTLKIKRTRRAQRLRGRRRGAVRQALRAGRLAVRPGTAATPRNGRSLLRPGTSGPPRS